ncbi:MAG: response regulator [Gammaproteobacteria bacterium]|nr:response regulator [Gammaproteobacteria bacterium]
MKTILIVDDEIINLEILSNILLEHFNLLQATSAEEGLEIVNDNQVDLILLDIVLPKMNGYEFCDKLKSVPATAGIPIIFTSVLTTLEDRLKAIDCGGNDYINKPINPDELLSKIHLIDKQEINNHKNNTIPTQGINLQNGLAELKLLNELYFNLLNIENIDQLSRFTIDSIKKVNLRGLIRIDFGDKHIFQSTDGEVRPMQVAVLEKSQTKSGQFHFKSNSIFNFENVSLVISNMPVTNTAYYNELINYFTRMVESISIVSHDIYKISFYENQSNHSSNNSEMISNVNSILSMVEKQQSINSQKTNLIINEYIDSLQKQFLGLGLTEEQENILIGLAESVNDNIQDVIDNNIELETKIKMAKSLLQL